MSITTALQSISAHRDVVPLYYDRRTGQFIITGVFRTKSGAYLVDSEGRTCRFYATKRDALASISSN